MLASSPRDYPLASFDRALPSAKNERTLPHAHRDQIAAQRAISALKMLYFTMTDTPSGMTVMEGVVMPFCARMSWAMARAS